MKFLVPNYSYLQNPWLGGCRPQIPVFSALCPQLNLLNLPEQNSWVRHWYQACQSHAPYCYLWPVRLYNIFPHYLIERTIFEKKKVIEHKMCFDFLWNFWNFANAPKLRLKRGHKTCRTDVWPRIKQKWREDEKEEASSYWMTLRKREDSGNWKGKQ